MASYCGERAPAWAQNRYGEIPRSRWNSVQVKSNTTFQGGGRRPQPPGSAFDKKCREVAETSRHEGIGSSGRSGHRSLPGSDFALLQDALVFAVDLEGACIHANLNLVLGRPGPEGTRHEYRHVKPHPYSKAPSATFSPSGSVMVNWGFPGRLPFTYMFVQISPAEPVSGHSQRHLVGA